MPDLFINTQRPVDRSIVAGANQPQRETLAGIYVAGSTYNFNLYFVRNDGSYDPASGDDATDVQLAISTLGRTISGTFTLSDGIDTTEPIENGATAEVVEEALNKLNGGTGLNLGSPSLVDVRKENDTQYNITFRSTGAMSAIVGDSVTLFPESSVTGSISESGGVNEYAQQTIEIVRQPAIYQNTWSTITNGFTAEVSLDTTRLLQSLVAEPDEAFYIEVKMNGQTVAKEVVTVQKSTMPASAFSAIPIKSLLDLFAQDPNSNAYFDAEVWSDAISATGGVTSVNGEIGDVLVATVEQGALADSAVQNDSTNILTNKTMIDISNEIHADMIHLHVRADEDILKGQAVKFDSYSIGQDSIKVSLADQSTDISIGIAEDDIPNNTLGLVVVSGVLKDVDTSSFTEGAVLYVNGNGDLQEAEPTTGYAQPIAICLRSNANNGVLQILADYPKQDSSDVRNDSNVTGATVSDALNYLETNLGVQAWGAISGTLSDQTDLQSALDLKQNILSEGAFVDGDKTKLDGIGAGANLQTVVAGTNVTVNNTDPQNPIVSATGAVDSVNGQTGAVILDADDIDDSATNHKFATQQQLDNADSALQPSDPTLDSITDNGSSTTNNITVGSRITTGNNTASGATATAIGGQNNTASGSSAEVLGGDGSTASGQGSSVIGGSNHQNAGNWSATVGGLNQTIASGAVRSAILGGYNHNMNHIDSVIIGGNSITSDSGNTVFVPNLNVKDGLKMPTGASDGYVLKTDSSGNATWSEGSESVGGATWVYNSSGYSDQIYGDIPYQWRYITQRTSDKLIVIGTSCKNIGEMAFVAHNNAQGGLAIPDSVETIGRFAFQTYAQSASAKGTLRLPSGLERIEQGTFQNSRFIGSLTLPETLTFIGYNAFESVTFSGDLTIPPLVTEIQNWAFYNNASLGANLTLPESLVTIGTRAFRACSGITTIYCYTTKTALDVFESLRDSGVMTIHAKASDSTWTAGSNLTIGDKSGITVIKDL